MHSAVQLTGYPIAMVSGLFLQRIERLSNSMPNKIFSGQDFTVKSIQKKKKNKMISKFNKTIQLSTITSFTISTEHFSRRTEGDFIVNL